MQKEYQFKNGYMATLSSKPDGESDISYEIWYKDGLSAQEVEKRLIARLVENIQLYERVLAEQEAKQDIRKTLPLILKLLANPELAKQIERQGYQPDVEALLKAVEHIAGWESTTYRIIKKATEPAKKAPDAVPIIQAAEPKVVATFLKAVKLGEYHCNHCGHLGVSHGGIRRYNGVTAPGVCVATDAAGDVCDCDNYSPDFYNPVKED
jgi:hypothetical protein